MKGVIRVLFSLPNTNHPLLTPGPGPLSPDCRIWCFSCACLFLYWWWIFNSDMWYSFILTLCVCYYVAYIILQLTSWELGRRRHEWCSSKWIFHYMNKAQIALFILLLADSLVYFQSFAVINHATRDMFPCAYVQVLLSGSMLSFSCKPPLCPCPEEVTSLVKQARTGVQTNPRLSPTWDCRGERVRARVGERGLCAWAGSGDGFMEKGHLHWACVCVRSSFFLLWFWTPEYIPLLFSSCLTHILKGFSLSVKVLARVAIPFMDVFLSEREQTKGQAKNPSHLPVLLPFFLKHVQHAFIFFPA